VMAVRETAIGIPRGGFLIILGPSGSGKTTLLLPASSSVIALSLTRKRAVGDL
jgi:ABC-type lipoprotein export system ATPase subunit